MSDSASSPLESSDLYTRLGVGKNASPREIKQAFRTLARDHHPDVAGDTPMAAQRFMKIREAYETLADPEKRARYDNRGKGRPGLNSFRWEPGRPQENQAHRQSFSDDLDLDDIFSDKLKGGIFRGASGAHDGPDFGFGGREVRRPEPGSDLSIRVVISPQLALRGGSQLLEYVRLRHKDGQSGLESYPEIFDFHFGAGTQHGDSIRIQRMGHGGANGGAYGDLICDIVIRDGQVSPKADRPSAGGGGAALAGRSVLRISVQKALLGGRVQVETPAGRFKVVIPPCTSSGTKMRLARKGQEGPGGLREDHEFEIQIQTPSELDEESRALIARFALLNPWGA